MDHVFWNQFNTPGLQGKTASASSVLLRSIKEVRKSETIEVAGPPVSRIRSSIMVRISEALHLPPNEAEPSREKALSDQFQSGKVVLDPMQTCEGYHQIELRIEIEFVSSPSRKARLVVKDLLGYFGHNYALATMIISMAKK